MSKQIGLFGGTFNPIHLGHLVAAQETLLNKNLSKVIFIPTGNPPHKSIPDASIKNRVEMTRLAIESNARFEISDIEASSHEPSYSINTVRRLQEQLNSDEEIYYLTGADELIDFQTWREWRTILNTVTVLGMSRPEFDLNEIPSIVKMKSEFVEIPKMEISSTLIRDRLNHKKPVQHFLPESVWKFINRHNLYIQ